MHSPSACRKSPRPQSPAPWPRTDCSSEVAMLVTLLIQVSPARACVCNPISGVLPIGEPEEIVMPPNGIFRLYEGDEGEATEEAWGVYDSAGALVPTTWERFPEVGGYTLIEL